MEDTIVEMLKKAREHNAACTRRCSGCYLGILCYESPKEWDDEQIELAAKMLAEEMSNDTGKEETL